MNFLDILRDTSKPLLKTDKISKDILNIKHNHRQLMSKTISQFQTPKPLEVKKIKKIVQNVAPDIHVEDIIEDDKKVKKEDETM